MKRAEKPMSPAEYGRRLAASAPPLTPEQVEGAVRILATVTADEQPQGAATHDAA